MATAPQPAPNPDPSAEDIVKQVYRLGVSRSELADECVDIAINGFFKHDLPRAVLESMHEGFQEMVGAYDRRWDPPKRPPRSGHKNSSGRFQDTNKFPGRGILWRQVFTNDGTPYKIGDLDTKIATRLRDEYASREAGNAAGRKFFDALVTDLTAKQKAHVRDLGEQHVARLQREANFRV